MGTQDSKNRLFIIGCSYSQYVNPTYADFLGADYNQTFNYALSGAGNRFIFHTAAYVFEKYKPKPNDTVIVQWSSVGRWDHVFNNKTFWTTPGSLSYQDSFSEEIVDKYFNLVAEAYNLINYVNAIKAISLTYGCNFTTFNMFDPWIELFYGEPYSTRIFEKYSDYIGKYYPFKQLEQTFKNVGALESVEEYIWRFPLEKPLYFYNMEGRQDESHPSTNQHLEYAKYLSKELGLGGDNLHTPKLKHYASQITDMFSRPDLTEQQLMLGEVDGHEWFTKVPRPGANYVLCVDNEKYPSRLFGNKYELGSNTINQWMQL